jgi:glycosyltransferase involved in cell wall biosynthesis
MAIDLAMVMPVYNEAACIDRVLRSWRETLAGLNIEFCMLVLDDGSTDGTHEILDSFHDDPRVEIIHKPNSGHGPTILEGYRRAVAIAEWVFQCDSDDELKPDAFPTLWERRNDYDALFGIRTGRRQTPGRRFITFILGVVARLLFGPGVVDANTPYRLMRSAVLEKIIRQIPDDTFAPNVVITGAIARAGLPAHRLPIPFEKRKTGRVSLARWNLWKGAFTALWQTLRCRPVIRRED